MLLLAPHDIPSLVVLLSTPCYAIMNHPFIMAATILLYPPPRPAWWYVPQADLVMDDSLHCTIPTATFLLAPPHTMNGHATSRYGDRASRIYQQTPHPIPICDASSTLFPPSLLCFSLGSAWSYHHQPCHTKVLSCRCQVQGPKGQEVTAAAAAAGTPSSPSRGFSGGGPRSPTAGHHRPRSAGDPGVAGE